MRESGWVAAAVLVAIGCSCGHATTADPPSGKGGPMFAAIYRFQVRDGMDRQFIQNWRIVTEAIATTHGALGSRLHREGDGRYVAYAAWPSREQWARPRPLPPAGEEARRAMSDACFRVETLHELEVVEDLLKSSSPR